MKNKTFTMANDVGIEVNYTILGITSNNDDIKYVVYTNFMPADNALGYRLLVGELVSDEPFEIKRVPLSLQREIADSFVLEIVKAGKQIKR